MNDIKLPGRGVYIRAKGKSARDLDVFAEGLDVVAVAMVCGAAAESVACNRLTKNQARVVADAFREAARRIDAQFGKSGQS